ncbi:MAG: hypothetical protein OEM82_08920 [Acidobacteriota bacterium]|nr:hypothetical protein [Acidobacteriota bacterium]MDH3528619.1 hypothetical protein [Acidobacteriota bacterium]
MKNEIIRISSRLAVVMGLAIILTGAVFAQAVSVNPKGDYTTFEKARSQARPNAKTQVSRARTIRRAKGESVSANNQANFNIGTNFMWAVLSSGQLGRNDGALELTIVDLVYLIDSLEGEPEAAVLQNTLRSVVRGTASSAQIGEDLLGASKSYSARLNKEQHWYFTAGVTVTNLFVDVYLQDDAAIKQSLATIQSLIKVAPAGTPEAVIGSMQSLAGYVSQTAFAGADYNALLDGAAEVGNSINA